MGLNESSKENKGLNLAFDTSGRSGSVAVGTGEQILAKRRFSGQMKHSSELFTILNELLNGLNYQPGDIENIFFTAGPGSFTGLRIGVTAAKMMYLAKNNIKIVGLNTLDCLALNAIGKNISRCGAILDAKRGLFFVSIYDINGETAEKTLDYKLLKADKFKELIADKPITVLGEGLVYYRDSFEGPNVDIADEDLWTVKIENVYRLGYKKATKNQFDDPVNLIPNYLRSPEAKIKPQMS